MATEDIKSRTDNESAGGLEVSGFKFLTKADADKARIDQKKIEYLESHVKMNTAVNIKTVYLKSMENKIFSTPVGWSYLAELRRNMAKLGGDVAELPVIDMKENFTHLDPAPGDYIPKTAAALPARKPKKNNLLLYSAIINIILLIMIIGMFVIASTNASPTVLNYREEIINEYSQWEMELQEREKALEEREAGE